DDFQGLMELVLEDRKIIRAFPKLDKCGIVPDFQIILGAFLMGNSPLIILYGLAAAAANILGGLLVSSRKLGQTALRYLIALGAGFMLAAVFLKIIPETVEIWKGEA